MVYRIKNKVVPSFDKIGTLLKKHSSLGEQFNLLVSLLFEIILPGTNRFFLSHLAAIWIDSFESIPINLVSDEHVPALGFLSFSITPKVNSCRRLDPRSAA